MPSLIPSQMTLNSRNIFTTCKHLVVMLYGLLEPTLKRKMKMNCWDDQSLDDFFRVSIPTSTVTRLLLLLS